LSFCRFFSLAAFLCLPLCGVTPDDAGHDGADLIERYLAASAAERANVAASEMEVEIEASLPRMGKKGTATARRTVSATGVIEYSDFHFDADPTIKTQVIARFIEAETEASSKKLNIGISRENYKFRYAGQHGSGDWQLHLLEVTPKQKRPGLFRGWIWVESRSNLAVREQGEFVKSPSIFLRSVAFVRDFVIRNGARVPASLETVSQTRIVGAAHLRMLFRNVRAAR